MDPFQKIQKKLHAFIVKYYLNALIKGALLFTTFGVLYLLFTLFIELQMWLKPIARTILFWSFILVELALLLIYILFPLFKLFGLQKGLKSDDAAKIIGKHFSQVDDKLLNLIQLGQSNNQSELLLASIEQKAVGLTGVNFGSAINFKQSLKYAKYLVIPLVFVILVLISGQLNLFKQSLNRVVHHQEAFNQPPPFSFKIQNKSLSLIEGQDFLLRVKTIGDIAPEQAEIILNDQHFFLKKEGINSFSFLLENLTEPMRFTLNANQVSSPDYQIKILRKPLVTGFKMQIDYPKYVHKQNKIVNNSGNATIPEGTKVTWHLSTAKTTQLTFSTAQSKSLFIKVTDNDFTLVKKPHQTLNYQISSSNSQLKDFEKLNYNLTVIKDAFPKISVTSDIDSAQFGVAQFAGQISDDYGLTRLQFVYADVAHPDKEKRAEIKINKTNFDSFYYLLDPQDSIIDLIKGIHYTFYFKVFDNDGVNGSKYTKSQKFNYYYKTDIEKESDLLQAQKQSLTNLQREKNAAKKLDDRVKKITDKLKSQAKFKWDDMQKIKDLILRQKKEEQLINNHLDNLKNNLNQDDKPSKNESLNEKKEALNKRLEEAKQLLKQEKELEQLKKLAQKLNKEGLLNRLEKFNQQRKQNNRTLARILELTKRFYLEKKQSNISQDLKELSKKQDSLAKSDNNSLKLQKGIEKKFDKLVKDLKQLQLENKSLAKPMALPKTKREEFKIKEKLKGASQKLESKNKKGAALDQKDASKQMSQMSQLMQKSMTGMGGEQHKENILTLQTILDNLIIFSLDQEDLLNRFKNLDDKDPEFSKNLRQQKVLKDYFEHIDDSIYTLSLRMPRLSVKIQNEITDAHYNINSALKNYADNKISRGVSNSQYAMTAANNLALMLNRMLDQLQNESSAMGKGKKGAEMDSFSLPDLIKKQSALSQKVKDGMKSGKDGNKGQESMSAKQYEVYKQQAALKQALKELMKKAGQQGVKGNKAKKMMDDLEQQLLDKGFNNNVLQKLSELNHELLKLDIAKKKQGTDTKRKATANIKTFKKRDIKPLIFNLKKLNRVEILNRKPLLLKLPYQKLVQQYFKDSI